MVLLGSGVFLFFAYRPDAADAWGDLYELEGAFTLAATARTLHWAAGTLLMFLLVLTVLVGLIPQGPAQLRRRPERQSESLRQNRPQRQNQNRVQAEFGTALEPSCIATVPPTTIVGRVVMLTLPVFALITLLTGVFLPWDHLALHAVTVGTDMQGYQPVFSDEVKFVLADGQVLGKGTVAWALVVHVSAAAAIGGWLLRRRHRRGPRKSVISTAVAGRSALTASDTVDA